LPWLAGRLWLASEYFASPSPTAEWWKYRLAIQPSPVNGSGTLWPETFWTEVR